MKKMIVAALAAMTMIAMTGCGSDGSGDGGSVSKPVPVAKNSWANAEGQTYLGWYGKDVVVGNHDSTIDMWGFASDDKTWENYMVWEFNESGNEALMVIHLNGRDTAEYMEYGVSSDAIIIKMDTDYNGIADSIVTIGNQINDTTYEAIWTGPSGRDFSIIFTALGAYL